MVRFLLVGVGSVTFTKIVKALRETTGVEFDQADSGGDAFAGLVDKTADLVLGLRN